MNPQVKRKETSGEETSPGPSLKIHKSYEEDDKDLSTWQRFCRVIPDKTEEEQSAVQTDILGYCRLWKICDEETFLQRWISHPNEAVRLDIFGELAGYSGRFCETIDDQVEWAIGLAGEIIAYEQKHGCIFATMAEGARHLEKRGIIKLQDQV